jgi:hypothetical protein
VYGYAILGFADPIRGMIMHMLNESYDTLERDKEKEVLWLGVTRRRLMQTLGTEWGRRMISPNVWLLHAKQRWDRHMHIAVPDVRFPNEVDFIRAYAPDATIWRIMRNQPYDPRDTAAQHPSETEVYKLNVDVVIPNTGTIPQLHAKIQQLMEHSYGTISSG